MPDGQQNLQINQRNLNIQWRIRHYPLYEKFTLLQQTVHRPAAARVIQKGSNAVQVGRQPSQANR